MKAAGHGTTEVIVHGERYVTPGSIRDVMYVPKLSNNLLLESQASGSYLGISFDAEACTITSQDGRIITKAPKVGSLYFLTSTELSLNIQIENNITIESAMFAKENVKKWHQRLGHLHSDMVLRISKSDKIAVISSLLDKTKDSGVVCKPCQTGKQQKFCQK